jgi:AAA ATPase domain
MECHDRGNEDGAPPAGRVISFGDFRLDRVERRLRRDDVELPLRAKSFELLRYLAENPGRLITREELIREVWRGTSVSDSVVRVGIRDVREALGDNPTAPRFVETVGRRGYRFVQHGAGPLRAGTASLVGRGAELDYLHGLLGRGRARRRQTVFVTGEAGIGKTALTDRFLEEVRGARLGRTARGQCVDLRGPREPYLPVLEMLGELCRGEDRREVVAALERWAPSWLLQMPEVVDADTAEKLRRRMPNPTRDRMLREFADLLEVLARNAPLVLLLEDLHWSDASTVDLLAYVAERTTPASLLVVGTYRPVEVVVMGHELRATVRDLCARGRCVELGLQLLTPRDIEAYLAEVLAGTPVDPDVVDAMHARTDGNPLFLVAIVEHLLERGILAVADGRWQLGADAEVLPPSLRALVAREIDALDDGEYGDAGTIRPISNAPRATRPVLEISRFEEVAEVRPAFDEYSFRAGEAAGDALTGDVQVTRHGAERKAVVPNRHVAENRSGIDRILSFGRAAKLNWRDGESARRALAERIEQADGIERRVSPTVPDSIQHPPDELAATENALIELPALTPPLETGDELPASGAAPQAATFKVGQRSVQQSFANELPVGSPCLAHVGREASKDEGAVLSCQRRLS